MSKKKNKIAWQKYEDLIEQQMSSPLLDILTSKISNMASEEYEEDEGEENVEYVYEDANSTAAQNIMLPISEKLLEDMTMLSNFDCWMAYTNFDITKDMKSILNAVEGIEVMRVCSRYRFFIGVGKMFNFKEVRSDIEITLL
jgi:hypothetical protein